MLIYNTLTREKEEFAPLLDGVVRMYVCGPTVYDFIHIGNARPVIFFDVVNRYFKHLGMDITYVSNVTDVDDKIIGKALADEVSESAVSEKYLGHYLESCEKLNVLPVDAMPKVTENMDEIIVFVANLVAGGFAYESRGDVYFRVGKVDEYGKLSGKKIDDLVVGARVEENTRKENPLDFTLWKKTRQGITWESPWGAGRPGWHTECVVMIDEAFKGPIDIHGGGADLQFPHHENEIAQSTCANGHNLANYWMHVGRLALDGEKMSKSLGNVIKLNDLLEDTDANVFRLFMLSSHYRQPISFSYEALDLAAKEWEKVKQAYHSLHRHLDLADGLDVEPISHVEIEVLTSEFHAAMNDDFNTANAISTLYALVKTVNKLTRAKAKIGECQHALQFLEVTLDVLGFDLKAKRLTDDDKDLFRKWNQARQLKNFDLADELRVILMGRDLIS